MFSRDVFRSHSQRMENKASHAVRHFFKFSKMSSFRIIMYVITEKSVKYYVFNLKMRENLIFN